MNDTTVSLEPTANVVVESNSRLSQSLLWRLQRAFFEQSGIDAWRTVKVPQYVTTNPFIAHAYARTVLGFLRAHRGGDRPVHIVELGTGPGRFAWHFVRKLLALTDALGWSRPAFRYVMTDLAERNVAFWRNHAELRPLVELGVLDFARFDVERDHSITLERSGLTLSPEARQVPLIVLANYVLDSLPQDVFHLVQGKIYESLVTVRVPDGADMADPASLEHCEVAFEDAPEATVSPYEDPSWSEILLDYASRLGDTHITFPSTAFTCLERFSRMAGGQLLVLTADYGDAREDALLDREPPELRWHGGCFSVAVNFHALNSWCERHGGELLMPAHRHSSLCIAALMVGLGDSRETRLAYREWIDAVSPDDFFVVKRGLDRAYELLTVPQLVAYLRLSGWDVDILRQAMTALVVRAEVASRQEQTELRQALLEVWRQRYRMGDDRELIHHITVLLYKMHFYADALALCESALEDYGPHAETYFDRAMALHRLGRLDEALDMAHQALALAPNDPSCRALRIRLEGEACGPMR